MSNDTAAKLIALRKRAWSVWTEAKQLVNATGRDDALFLKHPVKAPTIEIVDHLKEIADKIAEEDTIDPVVVMSEFIADSMKSYAGPEWGSGIRWEVSEHPDEIVDLTGLTGRVLRIGDANSGQRFIVAVLEED